jgi:hypothetical protein
MRELGVLIMVTAALAYIGCRIAGVRDLYVLRGRTVRVTTSLPAAGLDSNYAVLTVRVLWLWVAAFLVGFVVSIASRIADAA